MCDSGGFFRLDRINTVRTLNMIKLTGYLVENYTAKAVELLMKNIHMHCQKVHWHQGGLIYSSKYEGLDGLRWRNCHPY